MMKLFQFRPLSKAAGGADSSRSQILWCPETTFAAPYPPTIPAAGMKKMRFNRSALNHRNTTAPSAEIRQDRMRTDMMLLYFAAEGGIDMEWSSGNIDGPPISTVDYSLIEAALCGTWNPLTPAPPVTPSVLLNGSVFRSFVVEQGFTDISQYITYRGMAVEEWDLNIQSRNVVMETITWMGVSGICNPTSLGVTPGPTIASNALSPITSGPYVTGFETLPPLVGVCVRSWQMKVKNNYRTRECVESRESGQFGMGTQDIAGTMEVYFLNEKIFNDMVNNTVFKIKWSIIDTPNAGAGGYQYDFVLPRVKIAATRQDITGVDTDIFQQCDWSALFNPGPTPPEAVGAQIQITRTLL